MILRCRFISMRIETGEKSILKHFSYLDYFTYPVSQHGRLGQRCPDKDNRGCTVVNNVLGGKFTSEYRPGGRLTLGHLDWRRRPLQRVGDARHRCRRREVVHNKSGLRRPPCLSPICTKFEVRPGQTGFGRYGFCCPMHRSPF